MENLYCKDQIIPSKQYQDNYDDIFKYNKCHKCGSSIIEKNDNLKIYKCLVCGDIKNINEKYWKMDL